MTTSIRRAPWFSETATRRVMAALEAACPSGSRFVGGCVRNTLLGEPVTDIDIATQLEPDETIAALEAAGIRAILTGYEHGTITAIANSEPFEITTLRRDVETDGRRAVVAFTKDWAEDAARRDFRMNALYADMQGDVHDPTGGGLEDLEARKIIFIGEPDMRLREDHLRNLRFFRFSAWYAGGIDPDGLVACARLKDGLQQIAAERIWKEFLRLMEAPSPYAAVEAMDGAGVLAQILPETEGIERLNGAARIEAWAGLKLSGFERFLCLLQPDRDTVKAVALRLRMSRLEQDRLAEFAKNARKLSADLAGHDLKAVLYTMGRMTARDAIIWRWAGDQDGRWASILETAESWERPVFPVTGGDLIKQGVQPGPAMGERLRELEARWIANGFSMDGLAD
jgi:poly(A) polymerase